VEEGLGQVVLVSGEAGIGKSRLVQSLSDRLAEQPYIRQLYRCSPYYQRSPLHPVIEFFERWLRYERGDSNEVKLDKLERALKEFSYPLTEAGPLLSPLLSLPIGDRYPLLSLSPEGQRDKTLELLAGLLREVAEIDE